MHTVPLSTSTVPTPSPFERVEHGRKSFPESALAPPQPTDLAWGSARMPPLSRDRLIWRLKLKALPKELRQMLYTLARNNPAVWKGVSDISILRHGEVGVRAIIHYRCLRSNDAQTRCVTLEKAALAES